MKGFYRAAILGAAVLFNIGAAPNWMNTVAKTEGGHRLGTPDAKVKLVAFELPDTLRIAKHLRQRVGVFDGPPLLERPRLFIA